MPLILAIEPDPRQAAHVAALSPAIDAKIVVVDSVEAALTLLETTRPDLVLTPPLLSIRDDASLTAVLRELGGEGVELQTLVIPMFATGSAHTPAAGRNGGLLQRFRKQVNGPTSADGCAPAVFAGQINEYLARMAMERRDREDAGRPHDWASPDAAASARMRGELLTVSTEAGPSLPPVGAEATTAPALAPPPTPGLERSRPIGPEMQDTLEAASDNAAPEAPTPESLCLEPIADDSEPADAAVEAEWEDLESFLEDLELEPHAPGRDQLPAGGDPEPDVIGLPSPDELWAPLETAHHQVMAPIEGPSMQPRRKTAPAKTPKAPRSTTRKAQPTSPRSSGRAKAVTRPMQDEWGLYDPEQCGFAALLARLQELTEAEAQEKERARRSAIMRR